jgi:hypothetical protein
MKHFTLIVITIIFTANAAKTQPYINTYNGGNGSFGLSEYGIATQANSGQSTIGAEVNHDGFANLNLGSNIGGTRRLWHISKRTSADNHSLQFYFYNGSTFGYPVLTIQPNGNIGLGTINPGIWFGTKTFEFIDARPVFKLSSSDPAGLGTIVFTNNAVNATTHSGEFHLNHQYNQSSPANSLIRFGGYPAGDILTLSASGNVGIGTSNASQKVEVNGNFLQNAENSAFGIDAQANARFGVIKKIGQYSMIASDVSSPILFGQTNQNGIFTNIASATLTERMRIAANGNVGIGSSSPSEKLTVNGTIYGKEVKVDLSVPGPDYVFEKDYSLTSLDELKSYIEANKHLPEVPSAKEMEQNGINVGEMEMLLLKKIEELTLHLIQQNLRITEQTTIIEQLRAEVNTLKNSK